MSERARKWYKWLTPAFRVVSLQAVILVVVSLVWTLAGGSGRSLLFGGLCATLPNAWMAWRVARRAGDDPQRDAYRMLWGAFEKLLLTGALLGYAILRFEEMAAPTFFVGFIVALATHHVASARFAGDGREA